MFNNELWQKPAGGAGGNFYTYQIANSFRWDSGYLKRTPGSAGNRQTWTFSCWIKQSGTITNSQGDMAILNAGTSGHQSSRFRIYYYEQKLRSSSADANYNVSSGVYRDPSAWQHIVWKLTGGTSYQYVNGVEVSTSGVSGDVAINNNVEHVLGIYGDYGTGTRLKGYMAEVVFIDGTALNPTSFASEKNGVWIPDDVSGLTFGSQGYYLNFADASAPGNDVSGNNNDWTNVSLSTHDQMLDTPTFNSNSNGGNFCTWNILSRTNPSLSYGASTFSEGNLAFAGATGGTASTGSTFSMQSGKWYAEIMQSGGPNGGWPGIGVIYTDKMGTAQGTSNIQPQNGFTAFIAMTDGNLYKFDASSGASYGSAFGNGDICNIAVDIDAGKIWWGKNGTYFASGNPATGANPGDTFTAGTTLSLWVAGYNGSGTSILNAGQDGTFAGAKTAQGNSDDTGYGNFYYDPPTAFLALCSGNLPTADEIDPAQTDDNYPQKLFSPTLYTGNGSASARNIDTGVASDWVWIKNRGAGSTDNMLYDSSRGVGKYLRSNKDVAEDTSGTSLSAFNSNGFQLSDNGSYLNAGSNTYVAWNWRANGGTTAANSVGGTSSVTQVDPSKALSIVTYTGISGSSGSSTVGHGMGVVPQLIFHKARNASGGWWTQFASGTNANYFLELNDTRAQTHLAAGTYGAMSRPTTSVFSINGVDGVGGESRNYVAYCFANIEGYCKVGSFVGNGNTDGPFIYTGFRPSIVIRKRFDGLGSWIVKDDARNPNNDGSIEVLTWNSDGAENAQGETSDGVDFLSNGFKLKATNNGSNGNGLDYFYLALSFNPFKYSTAF